MALFATPAEHAANPPATWPIVRFSPVMWKVYAGTGGVIATTTTLKAARAVKAGGFHVDLYEKEGRWYRGETVPGWKPYAPPAATS